MGHREKGPTWDRSRRREARESDERTGMVARIETEFARAVGYRVQLELLNKLTGTSSLSAIAEKMHLALDPQREKEGRPGSLPPAQTAQAQEEPRPSATRSGKW